MGPKFYHAKIDDYLFFEKYFLFFSVYYLFKAFFMKKPVTFCLIICLILTVISMSAQKSDTLTIFYEINEYSINTKNAALINELLNKKNLAGVSIYSYTDFLGSDELNKKLSNQRSNAVKQYLIKSGFKSEKILESKGIGKLDFDNKLKMDGDRGIPNHRRTEIVYFLSETKIADNSTVQKNETIANNAATEKPVVIPIFSEINLENVKAGETIILDNMLFHGGTHRMIESSMPTLRRLLMTMNNNPNLKIRIEGHICCHQGDEDGYDFDTRDNNLSTNRAKSVYDYLYNNGISEDRMSFAGYGARFKLYPYEKNTYEEDMNRRVEIVIVEK